jgi:hypothetical protein
MHNCTVSDISIRAPLWKFNCVKKIARKTSLNLLWHRRGFPSGVIFFVSSVCLILRVTMVDKNKAVVCCLLATSAII